MKNKTNPLAEAIVETADDLHRLGMLSEREHQKITVRHLGNAGAAVAQPISPDEIKQLRETANLSQAAFARYLNLTTGYISQLERGVKKAKGPALALLNVIRRKGIEAVL